MMRAPSLLALVLLAGVVPGHPQSHAPGGPVRFSGVIADFYGAPHRNQVLKIKAGNQEVSTTTDEHGAFAFQNVTPNRDYWLFIGERGIMGIHVPDHDLSMNIGSGQNSPIRISGRAVDHTGAPLPNQTVSLNQGAIEIARTRTAENGRFILSAPPDQDYSLRIAVAGLGGAEIEIDAENRPFELGSVVIQPAGHPLAPPGASVRGARTSGRLTDANGALLSGKVLSFVDVDIPGQPRNFELTNSTLATDSAGFFVFPAAAYHEYEVYVIEPGRPAVHEFLGKIEVSRGLGVDIGVIAMGRSPGHNEPVGVLKDAVEVASATSTPKMAGVAAIFIGANGTNVIKDDGKVIHPAQEEGQVGSSSPRISEDRTAAGWLVESDSCCTSYPLEFMLVVYRSDKPLRRFTGDGRAIFAWKFVNSGHQISLYQSFPHGPPVGHYELRDIESGRLVGRWDENVTAPMPAWARALRR
ncbi:MAG: carboxypeptidase-like regulatory domain-containing protein [Acidobacteriota bacterium]